MPEEGKRETTEEANEENSIEIQEEVTEEKEFDTEGLLDEEIEIAKEHGLIKDKKDEEKGKEKQEKSEEESKDESDDSKESSDGDDEVSDEDTKHPTFDDVDKNKDLLKKYNPNEQALYWKYKSDRKKRQAAEKKADELQSRIELEQIKDKASAIKLKKVSEALSNPDLTVEQLQAIIGDVQTGDTDDDSKPLTKADLERIEQEKQEKDNVIRAEQEAFKERTATAEEIGNARFGEDKFNDLVAKAQEVVDSDKSGTYKSVLDAAFNDKDTDESELVERVFTIAKLHPDFGKTETKEIDGEKVKDVDRMVKNANKKKSSASVGSSGSRRVVNYDDLTVEDAATLTPEQWKKVPQDVRERILMS